MTLTTRNLKMLMISKLTLCKTKVVDPQHLNLLILAQLKLPPKSLDSNLAANAKKSNKK